jgi:hypothetical protein
MWSAPQQTTLNVDRSTRRVYASMLARKCLFGVIHKFREFFVIGGVVRLRSDQPNLVRGDGVSGGQLVKFLYLHPANDRRVQSASMANSAKQLGTKSCRPRERMPRN